MSTSLRVTFGLFLLAWSLVAPGCGPSLRELRQTASQLHHCPKDRTRTLFHENRRAMLDVCGTWRKFNYRRLGREESLAPDMAWKEEATTFNFFTPMWLDMMMLWDAWGSSARDIWVVGTRGAVFRFDGKKWRALDCEENPPHYLGVWGADAEAVWAAGSEGRVLRWDGKAHRVEQLPTQTDLVGVHGTSRSDVWIVGRKGLIVHFDGTSWKPVESGVKRDLYRVFAVRRDLAWAVGDQGTLLTWDGRRWKAGTPGTRAPLVTVWASSEKDAWIGARNGQVYHFDGRRWTGVRVFSVDDIKKLYGCCVARIFGFGRDDVWLMGCRAYHFDGRAWRPDPLGKGGGGTFASWGSSPRDIYSIGGWGYRTREEIVKRALYRHWDGKRQTRHEWPVWPCNRPRGKAGPRPFKLRPTGPGY
jgi:hypothetical protein